MSKRFGREPKIVEPSSALKKSCKDLLLDNNDLKKVMSIFLTELEKGLSKEQHADSVVKAYVTYLQDLPNAKDLGNSLVIDFGGVTFRILFIQLKTNFTFTTESKTFTVPENVMNGEGIDFFEFIVDCLLNFMFEKNLTSMSLPLAFAFGFPCIQLSLTKAILQSWCKGFNCHGVIGKDVVGLLRDAINRRGKIPVKVCALLNDTTGVLMLCAWKKPNTRIGVIIDAGTNAAYLEHQDQAKNFNVPNKGSGKVIINTEWGAFGDNGSLSFICTDYDREIDSHDSNPGFHVFEKMTSAHFLGEIVRLIIEKLTSQKILFSGRGSGNIFKKYSFINNYITEIESDPVGTYTNCLKVFEKLGIKNANNQDCANLRYICECVSRRSAHLISATLAVLINKVNESSITVAIDGALYRYHPYYHTVLMNKTRELIDPKISFDMQLSPDGTGVGAALVAAVVTRKTPGQEERQVKTICKTLVLNNNDLKQVMWIFMVDVEKGLCKRTHADSAVKCYIAYLQELPNGQESGRFLVLDLGVGVFRVLLVEFIRNDYITKFNSFAIPDNLLNGPGENLFDFLADGLLTFVKEQHLSNEKLPLAFMFPFPVLQKGPAKAILYSWSKGFSSLGIIGTDVVSLLNDAIRRKGDSKLEVSAIVNDTIGTIMSCAYTKPSTKIGVVIGKGTNACYIEDQKNAEIFDELDVGSGKILINTEWAGFGDDESLNFIRTEFDKKLDSEDRNPHFHVFEKMTSGLFMGEIVRLVLEKCTRQNLIFNGEGSKSLFKKNRFYIKYITEIESDHVGMYTNCRRVLAELDINDACNQDCANLRYICECVSRRSAHLISATLAVLINKINKTNITVGISGSLYIYHPHYNKILKKKLRELVNHKISFELVLSEDGNGRGSALTAAVALRQAAKYQSLLKRV